MPKVLSSRAETPEEQKIREWFEQQAIESPKNLEDMSRLLISLVTGLLGVLFGVLTVAADKLPIYLSNPWVKAGGIVAVVCWLISLLAGIFVALPHPYEVISNQPASETKTFEKILKIKSTWLTVSAFSFGLAVIALGCVLIFTLLLV